ncbi:MAG: replication-associated recombination protein A [Calditrichaeota bacterium]|nr:replication-associated recombination protein A [Calditrichota bacterium]
MRPATLEEFFGQEHLLGPDGLLRKLIERDHLPSMIFWGEPGSGKTTLARIIARITRSEFVQMSAVSSGLPELRKIIEQALAVRSLGLKTILFIDEIHRWSKSQQDALLPSVEDGTIILIGATTENPSFEVIGPLLSRCRVFRFQPLQSAHIKAIIERAIAGDEDLRSAGVSLSDEALEALSDYSGGDARVALNGLEVAVELSLSESDSESEASRIMPALVERALMERRGRYDKKGEYHYDVISAFIKSLRGSDPDAALYYLARMLDAGEDPLFIARRMVVLASEDIGNANPNALVLAVACYQACHFIGMPEARLNLAQAVTYLAASPKSNASYVALMEAQADVKSDPDRPVPLHLRNAVTGLMKSQGYGKGYQYDHDHGGFSGQTHLPEGLEERIYYRPTEAGSEKAIKERLESWWKKRNK